jgi:hypothetical protein
MESTVGTLPHVDVTIFRRGTEVAMLARYP